MYLSLTGFQYYSEFTYMNITFIDLKIRVDGI